MPSTVPTSLDWLTARPIAHRGLHDAAHGVIENTAGAVRAAIAAGYGIEVDVQISADGEAMVHHDDVLGRLTEGAGRLDRLSAAALKHVPFRGSAERMMTLGELCDLVDGRVTMLIELKSRFDGDAACLRVSPRCSRATAARPRRCRSIRARLPRLRHKAPRLVVRDRCGQIPAASILGSDAVLDAARHGLSAHRPWRPEPQFVAYAVADLPALAPLAGAARFWLAAVDLGGAHRGRAKQSPARLADQMIFEGFRP